MNKAMEILNIEKAMIEEFITLLESKIAICNGNLKDLMIELSKSKIIKKEIEDAISLLRM